MIRSLKIKKTLSLILSFCLVLSAFCMCADGIFAKAEAMTDDGLGRVNLAGLLPSELKSVNYNGSGACPYVSGDRYVINDFESLNNLSAAYATTLSVNTANAYDGNNSVKMNADAPVGQGFNVGAMMLIHQSGMNLSQYAYLHFNYYLSRDFDINLSSELVINLATEGEDGFNFGLNLSGKKKGWHTFTVPMSTILNCVAVASANITNINTVRITWFNHCQENTPTYFEFDNMYMSQNQSVELVSGTSGHKLESVNRSYSSGVRLIPGSNNTATVTYNVKYMSIIGFSGIFCKNTYAYSYGSDVSAEIFADGSSVGSKSGINTNTTDKFVCSIPQTTQTVQIKVTWNGGDAIPVDICDGAFLYTTGTQNVNAVYLSDMQEEYVASLDNIYYRDLNNVGQYPISIEGMTFEKGLSLHPMPDKPAMLSYDITDLNSNTFVSYIGQCDTAMPGGDGVRCLIYVDGQLKYDKTFMYNTPADLAVIDVTNANQLYIRLENNGNYASDAFSLGDAHFVLNGTPDVFASSYNTVDLTGREMKNVSSNGGTYHINTALENTNPLVVGYKHFNHGISMHPFSNARAYVEYDLTNFNADYFTARVGKTQETSISTTLPGYTVSFSVYVDNRLVYQVSRVPFGYFYGIGADVRGAKTLRIEIDNDGDYTCDASAICQPLLYYASGNGSIYIEEPKNDISARLFNVPNFTIKGYAPEADSVSVSDNGAVVGNAVLDGKGGFTYNMGEITSENNNMKFTAYKNGQPTDSADFVFISPCGNTLSLTKMPYSLDKGELFFKKGPYRDKQLMIGGGILKTDNGFCVHPNAGSAIAEGMSDLSFDISQISSRFSYFEVTVGRDDFAPVTRGSTRGSARCTVLIDGNQVAVTSKVMAGSDYEILSCAVPAGARTLTLRTDNYDGTNVSDYMDWLEPVLAREHSYIYRTEQTAFDAGNAKEANPSLSLAVRYKTTAPSKGLTFTATAADASGITAKLYRFTYTRARSMQEGALTEGTYFGDSSGKYTMDFVSALPAGEYILVLENAVGMRYSESTAGNIYIDGTCKKGFANITVKFADFAENYFAETSAEGSRISSTKATNAEKSRAGEMISGYINNLATFPSTVNIGGVAYTGFDPAYFSEITRTTTPGDKRETTLIKMMHNPSGIEFDLTVVYYPDYAAFDWVVYFTNTTGSNSATVTAFNIADMNFKGNDPYYFTSYGESEPVSPYYPEHFHMKKGDSYMYDADSGRSSEQDSFPYYNFEYGNKGALVAVGWPGCWRTNFDCVADDQFKFTACQSVLNAYLEPGETLRTPLMAMVLYDGRDLDRASNLWRNWFIDCNMYTENGKLPEPGVGAAPSAYLAEMMAATDQNTYDALKAFKDKGVILDYWWMDAGWYDIREHSSEAIPWLYTGLMRMDPDRFPTKLADVKAYAEANDIKTILWFEPERVGMYVNELATKSATDDDCVKPEWLCAIDTDYHQVETSSPYNILNLGNEECLQWLIRKVSGILTTAGISVYREDFNGPPMQKWMANDTAGRTGVTENKCAEGHLRYWDALLALDCVEMIDSCASGGHRLDLESMRRAVALHPADHDYDDYVVKQTMAYSLCSWIPYIGANFGTSDINRPTTYQMRSSMRPYSGFNTQASSSDFSGEYLQNAINFVNDFNSIKGYFYDDLYQLTDWNISPDKWYSYEYFNAESNSGYAMVYRRNGAVSKSNQYIKLKGLDPSALYVVNQKDAGITTRVSGFEAMEKGIPVTLNSINSADIVYISPISYEPYVSDLSSTDYKGDGQAIVMNTDFKGNRITFSDGQSFDKGVGLSGGAYGGTPYSDFYAYASFDISSVAFNRFTATVGSMCDYVYEDTEFLFQVICDGQVICETPHMHHSSGGYNIDTPIPPSAKTLTLKVLGNRNTALTVCFANAKLSVNYDENGEYLARMTDDINYTGVWSYKNLSTVTCKLFPGDKLVYDVYIDGPKTPGIGGMALFGSSGYSLINNIGYEDQNGISGYPTSDISSYCAYRWFTRELTIPNDFISYYGETITASPAMDRSTVTSLATGTAKVYYDNIRIVRGDKTVAVFFDGSKYADGCNGELIPNMGWPELSTLEKVKAVDSYTDAILGDISLDNVLNVFDALKTLQGSLEMYEMTDKQKYIGDVDKSGEVDSLDALLILQYTVELIKKFPVQ